MPTYRYKSIDYPLSNPTVDPYASVGKILHAAITVGRAPFAPLLPYGAFSRFEIIYRLGMVYANLGAASDSSAIVRSPAYQNLDPSEKSAVSYYLALVFAKLVAAEYLSTPWLMHLDVYQDEYPAEMWKGSKRPDLFGLNKRRDWVILESKGRSGAFSNEAFKIAKAQTRNVKKIDGTYPGVRVASELFFQNDKLSIRLEDPREYDEDAPDIDVSQNRFISDYYHRIRQLIASTKSNSQLDPATQSSVYLPEVDLTIGIPDELIAILDGDSKQMFNSVLAFTERTTESPQDSSSSFSGSDGVFVKLGTSWNGLDPLKDESSARGDLATR